MKKSLPNSGLIDFAQEGTGKRPRTLGISQVVIVFRERLHMSSTSYSTSMLLGWGRAVVSLPVRYVRVGIE